MSSTSRTRWLLASGVVLLLVAGGAGSARAEGGAKEEARASAAIGGLHRAAAGVEAALSLYRHALIELVAAAARVEAEATTASVTPRASIPEPAAEVFRRLSETLPDRVPAAALPVLARSYHGEVTDALERLRLAEELGQVVVPLADLARGMAGVCATAEMIGDLFSRRRPIQMQLVDPDLMLIDVANALDQVMVAEQRIAEARRREAPAGEQFQAVRALEIALGHALDLIALAEQAGLHIGFEVQLGAAELAASAARVRSELAALAEVLAVLRRPPGALRGPLRAWGRPRGEQLEVSLRWTPSVEADAAAVHVYRRFDRDEARARLSTALLCEGKSEAQAAALAESAVEELSGQELLVGELAPGRSSFSESMPLPIVSPHYRVVAVSSFAVEGEALRATAVAPPLPVVGPAKVAARSLAPSNQDPSFYFDYDAVEVTWQLSPNDERPILTLGTLAGDLRQTRVVGYRVLRLNERGDFLTVGRLPSGSTRFVDRVPLDRLADGVRYSVEAIVANGQAVRPPAGCAESVPVRLDLRPALRLARWGYPVVRQPVPEVRARAAALTDAGESWAKLVPEDRREIAESWWQAQTLARRRALLERWPAAFAEVDDSVLSVPPATLTRRDAARAIAEAWLSSESPEVQAEVDRWWQLLAPRARQLAVAGWRRTADPEVVAALGGAPQTARVVRLEAWWMSRDGESTAQLAAWWQSLPAEERDRRLRAWYAALSPAEQRAAHWPAWSRLEADERQARLASPPPLPPSLQAEALAFYAWAGEVARADAAAERLVRAAVGIPARWRAALAYALRPVDLALSWRLRPVMAFAAVLLAAGGLAWWARRREVSGR